MSFKATLSLLTYKHQSFFTKHTESAIQVELYCVPLVTTVPAELGFAKNLLHYLTLLFTNFTVFFNKRIKRIRGTENG